MSQNKFNQYGTDSDSNVTNGTLDIYGFSLKAENLDANLPVKTSATKKLISSKLNISDVNNLQAELDSSIQNPNQNNLVSDGVEITNGNVLKTDTIERTTGGIGSGVTFNSDLLTANSIISTGVINGRIVAPERISSVIPTDPIAIDSNFICSNTDITGVNNLEATTTKTDNLQTVDGTSTIQLNNSIVSTDRSFITNTGEVRAFSSRFDNISSGTGTLNPVIMGSSFDMGTNDITNAGIVNATSIDATRMFNTLGTNVLFQDDIEMKSNDILGVGNLNVSSINGHSSTGDITMNGNDIILAGNVQTATLTTSGGSAITVNNNLSLGFNNITSARNITLQGNLGQNVEQSFFQSGTGTFKINKDVGTTILKNEGTETLTFAIDQLNTDKQVQLLNTGDMLIRDYNLDMNQNDINNIRSMTISGTQYISRIEDMGAPVGNYYVIPDNTTWIILGQITLTYGIEFGVNSSLRGIDFSSEITFDETNNDCDIKAVDNNFYLSQLTIVNGGGRNTGNPASIRGLLNATNYNLGAPAPFYGRNKRFKITDCNILRPFKIGTIEGFGTLNVTNNFFNGGGGLAGQATSYYTNEGLSVSDGLSLEFNNNKMVLMLGAQQVSTLKLLNMKARVSSLLGFNACTITGNIFHPRNSETGIDFDADSRTALGNISGNVFIRTGGSSPLINYTDQTIYDNYNPLSIENYSINANTGVVNSEINLSSRFGIQLDLTGVSVAFVANERITDTSSGNTALILAVDAEAGGNQSVYITDMSGKFDLTPTTFTSATGSATGGTLRYIFRYSEKDPRKLVLNATFSVSVGSNKEYFISPSMNGIADSLCEVGGVSTNTGAGATLTVVCAKKYEQGDKEQFFFRTTDASAGNITKGIIIIK
jgi:hypothetical protein